jgi:hypothetical protein
MLKKFVAAAASIALVTTPVLAAGSNAASSEIAPSSETISGDNQLYGSSLLLQAGILLALILGGYFLYDAIDKPSSP